MGDGDSEGENLMKLRINHHQQKKQIPIAPKQSRTSYNLHLPLEAPMLENSCHRRLKLLEKSHERF